MKYADMSAERKAAYDALVAAQLARKAERDAAKAARKAERDARLADVGNAGLPELRDIVQGLIEEMRRIS